MQDNYNVNGMSVRIHWLTVVFHSSVDVFLNLAYEGVFDKLFGDLVLRDFGGRFYKHRYDGLLGTRIYFDPYETDKYGETHVCFDLPGSACDVVTPERFVTFMKNLNDLNIPFSVTRIDIAFDYLPFTPADLYSEYLTGELNSLVKRSKYRWIESGDKKANGEDGCTTFEYGSNQSGRMVTCYDKRGYTRLEFQCRDKRADLVANDLLKLDYFDWWACAVGHLRQYSDYAFDAWLKFVECTERFAIRISSARALSIAKMAKWAEEQLSMALYCLQEVSGGLFVSELLEKGRERYTHKSKYGITRYDALLQLA
jgi:DNA relaxase NicK